MARPVGQPDVNPARVAADPLLTKIAAMVAELDLHVGARTLSHLDDGQKELWADLVDSAHVNTALDDPDADIAFTPRWWRDDYDRTPPADGDVGRCEDCSSRVCFDAEVSSFWRQDWPHSEGRAYRCADGRPHRVLPVGSYQPDPFRYVDEGGARQPAAPDAVRADEAAARVARHALLDVLTNPAHEHRHRLHVDFAALYDWAKASVRPLRRTTGEHAGEIGPWTVYPSPADAAEFLDTYRTSASSNGETP